MSLYENLLDLIKEHQPRPKSTAAAKIHVDPPTTNSDTRLQNDIAPSPIIDPTRNPRKAFVPYNKSVWTQDNESYLRRTEIDLNQSASQKNWMRKRQQIIEEIHRDQAESVTANLTNALYVGNIRWWITDQTILDLFSQFGVVTKLKIETCKITGKSKGFGYVQFESSNQKAATLACQKLNGYFLEDNGALVVKMSSKNPPRVQTNNVAIDFTGNAGGGFNAGVASQFSGGIVNTQFPKSEIVTGIHGRFNPVMAKREGLQTPFYTSFQNQPIIPGVGIQGADVGPGYIKRRRLGY